MLKDGRSAPMPASPYAGLAGKEVVLISHELTLTGAPLLLTETARQLQKAGAIVRMFSLADDQRPMDPAEVADVPVLPVETSIRWAARADLVIANTAVARSRIEATLVDPRKRHALLRNIHGVCCRGEQDGLLLPFNAEAVGGGRFRPAAATLRHTAGK
jgi:hypothetical protein